MTKIQNGDARAAVVNDILSKVFAYGRFKRDMKKAADVGLNSVDSLFMWGSGYTGNAFVFGITFQSPVHDGWLNEHKPVADLFFRAYAWGGKHWPDEVEDIYPHLSLYIRTVEELERYDEWTTSFSLSVAAQNGVEGADPRDAENSTIPADAYTLVNPVYEAVEESVYNELTGWETRTVQKLVRIDYTFYAISLSRLFEIPNKLFYDFVTDGRISSTVDFAKASWLESWLPVITIALGVVLVASVGLGTELLSSQGLLNAGFAALGDTLAPLLLEALGSEAIMLAGAAATGYELYSGFSMISQGLNALGGGVESGYIPPERLKQKMNGIFGMESLEFFPWETTYQKFEINIGG